MLRSLYIVIERLKNRDPLPVSRHFDKRGRLAPACHSDKRDRGRQVFFRLKDGSKLTVGECARSPFPYVELPRRVHLELRTPTLMLELRLVPPQIVEFAGAIQRCAICAAEERKIPTGIDP